MKTTVTGMGLLVIIVISVMINLNILNFTSRSSELNTAVNNAIVDTQRVLYDKSYPINNFDEYISEFTQNVVQYINSNSDITIKIYTADEKTGLLDVGIVSTYKNPTGKTRTYEIRRTSIVDRFKNDSFNSDDLKDSYNISFSVSAGIELDLSGVNFFVPKEKASSNLEIPLKGTISKIYFDGDVVGSYSTILKNGKSYLHIEVKDMKGDVNIKIQ